jgi:hypothetical protein
MYDILSITALTQDTAYYGALFAKVIMAQKAAIDELQTKTIVLSSTGKIRSENYVDNSSGFELDAATGQATLMNAKIKGDILSDTASFRGDIEAPVATFWSELVGSNMVLDIANSTVANLKQQMDQLITLYGVKSFTTESDDDAYAYLNIISNDNARPYVIAGSKICPYLCRYTESGVVKYTIGNIEAYERLVVSGSTKYIDGSLSNYLRVKSRPVKLEAWGDIYSRGKLRARNGILGFRRGLNGDRYAAIATSGQAYALFDKLGTPYVDGIMCWYRDGTTSEDGSMYPGFAIRQSSTVVRFYVPSGGHMDFTKDSADGVDKRYFYF